MLLGIFKLPGSNPSYPPASGAPEPYCVHAFFQVSHCGTLGNPEEKPISIISECQSVTKINVGYHVSHVTSAATF